MTLRRTVSALALAALVAGCADGQGPSQRQAGGAAIGGILGAAVGLATGGERKDALIGAGIGSILGAGVGTWLDSQQAELEEDLDGTGARVEQVDDALLVTLPEGVTFELDSAQIQPRFRRPLNQVSQTLMKYESSYIDVVGHADSTGSDAYNQALSERRAEAVSGYLAGQGVDRVRLVAIGRGESEPIASNATPEGRSANRRVEITITPLT